LGGVPGRLRVAVGHVAAAVRAPRAESWMRVVQFRACRVRRACSGAMLLIRAPASAESGRGASRRRAPGRLADLRWDQVRRPVGKLVASPAVMQRVGITALAR